MSGLPRQRTPLAILGAAIALAFMPALGLPARIDDRVEEVVEKVRARAMAEALDPDLAEALWRRLIDWSIAREERLFPEAGGGK